MDTYLFINCLMKREYMSRVFICGAGHQGLSMAAHLALSGNTVTLWNRSYNNIATVISTREIFCDGVVKGMAVIEKASTAVEDVFYDFVMVTTPSSAHKDIAKQLAPFVSEKTVIILNPGRTFGAIEFANALLNSGVSDLPHIAETQTIVYTCRKKGENSVTIFALKQAVQIAALVGSDMDYIWKHIPECIRQNFVRESSIGVTSFSNVGMVLHCAPVLMNIGWIESTKVDFKYYYDGISPSISRYLEKVDKERIEVARAMGFTVESTAEWIRRVYGVSGKNLYECIKNNESYREIDAPPSIYGRYITEDVPNGLVPIEYLGKALEIPTPAITTIVDLANLIMECDYRVHGRKFSESIIKKYI